MDGSSRIIVSMRETHHLLTGGQDKVGGDGGGIEI